jgi:uncharacterized membrane protein
MKHLILSILCLFSFFILESHQGHQHQEEKAGQSMYLTHDQPTVKQFGGRPENWKQWVGGFHFIFLHFPIALIILAAFAELCFARYRKPIFDYSSQFMLIAAAILAPPTALFGFIYSSTVIYEGLVGNFVQWHLWLGVATALFTVMVALIREFKGISKLYYICLFLLFLLVNITSMLGGGITFGPYHLLPPA